MGGPDAVEVRPFSEGLMFPRTVLPSDRGIRYSSQVSTVSKTPRARDNRADDHEMQLATSLRTSIAKLSKMSRTWRANRNRDPAALPYSLMSALSSLERLGPTTPTGLAAHEGVRKPSVTRSLATLVERGLIVRAFHPTDGRQAIICISPQGVKAVRESRRIIDAWYAARLAELSEEDRDALRAAEGALRKLAEITDYE